jgi:hypothetical protein
MNEKLQVFRSQYEAARAAQIAFDHARHLAAKYNVTDPPLIHNFKVTPKHASRQRFFLSVLMLVSLAIGRMNFLLWSEFRGAVTISLNQWWNGPSCCS